MPRKQQTQQIDKEFFVKLLSFEHIFYTQECDEQAIQELVKSYANLVEKYDLNKDPIGHYFLEKMQYVLSRPQTLSSLIHKLPVRGRHSHHFSQPALKFENLVQVQSITDLNGSSQKIQSLTDDYEKQQRDQSKMVEKELNLQKSLFQQKLLARQTQRKSKFAIHHSHSRTTNFDAIIPKLNTEEDTSSYGPSPTLLRYDGFDDEIKIG